MNTTLHITINKELKDRAQEVAEQLGLDVSSIVRASLLSIVRTGKFQAENNPRMTPFLESVISEAEKEKKSVSFKNSKQAIDFLQKRCK